MQEALLRKFILEEGCNIPLPPIEPVNISDRTENSYPSGLKYNKSVKTSRRIYIKPETNQNKILQQWFVINDQIYNFVVKKLLNLGYKNLTSETVIFEKFRKEIKDELPPNIVESIDQYGFPSNSIYLCIDEVLTNFDTARNKLAKGTINSFRIRYRKMNKNKKTMQLAYQSFSTKSSIQPTVLGNKMKTYKNVSLIGLKTCKLQWNNSGKHKYTIFATDENWTYQYGQNRAKSCSLDPGVAVFQTLYDGTKFAKLGEELRPKIRKLFAKIDKVEAIVSGPKKATTEVVPEKVNIKLQKFEQQLMKSNKRKPKWYKRFIRRIYDKIKHTVKEAHEKISLWLCRHYSEINIGKISTAKILQNEELASTHKRELQQMSHYSFRELLKKKAEKYDAHVIEINESYTSKMCGRCAKLNVPEYDRQYICAGCNFTIDRDFNGCRNIYFKRLMLN